MKTRGGWGGGEGVFVLHRIYASLARVKGVCLSVVKLVGMHVICSSHWFLYLFLCLCDPVLCNVFTGYHAIGELLLCAGVHVPHGVHVRVQLHA